MTQLSLIEECGYNETLSQWYTRPKLAQMVVDWALEGVDEPISILEPSAGVGALVRPIPSIHTVVAIEPDSSRAKELERGIDRPVSVHCIGFEQYHPLERFDLAIMNPPYELNMDVLHCRKATVICDRVVAVLQLTALQGVRKNRYLWQWVDIPRMAICERRQRFDGEKAYTPTSGTVVIEMIRRKFPRSYGEPSETQIEWWNI
jgi:predicted RNA methylase